MLPEGYRPNANQVLSTVHCLKSQQLFPLFWGQRPRLLICQENILFTLPSCPSPGPQCPACSLPSCPVPLHVRPLCPDALLPAFPLVGSFHPPSHASHTREGCLDLRDQGRPLEQRPHRTVYLLPMSQALAGVVHLLAWLFD